ncbi:MAG: hypothetical protein JWM85_372 [Acidimicrobiaceae bacterium]|nr:hypothetical protein [Acidimicrobiaceae bacterium]
MTVHVGTSGWQYDDWRPAFYPERLPKARWLAHYAESFATVEVNNAFYRLPEASTFTAWKEATPDDFVIGVKASRYLTHVKRLREPEEPVGRLMERCQHLGEKLGPILLQLPPTFRKDLGALRATLEAFPPKTMVAVEPRHDSWFVDETAELLAACGAAYCLSDAPGRRPPRWRTAGFGYLRMHAGTAAPSPCYGRQALRSWAEWLAGTYSASEDVFVYFNNDANACAPRDAARFAGVLERVGLPATRVPPVRSLHLAEAPR